MVVDVVSLIGVGVVAFVATNIDDIVVLMVFFSSSTFHASNIVIGRYLGIGSIIAISVLGSLIALVVPPHIIGLMGLVPIAIGIKELLQIRNNKDRIGEEEEEEEVSKKKLLQEQEVKIGIRYHQLSFLAVAAVSFQMEAITSVSIHHYLPAITLLQK